MRQISRFSLLTGILIRFLQLTYLAYDLLTADKIYWKEISNRVLYYTDVHFNNKPYKNGSTSNVHI